MDVAAIRSVAPGPHAPEPSLPVDQAVKREVVQAIKAVNGVEMFGSENELRFQQDPHTQRTIVRLVNRKTDEVVSQVPTETVLRLGADLKRS